MYDSNEMYFAAGFGEYKTVAKLLAQDPLHRQINELIDDKRSALFRALNDYNFHSGHYRCLLLLLDADADPYQYQFDNERDPYPINPFFKAVMNRDLSVIRAILLHNPDYENKTKQISSKCTITAMQCIAFAHSAEVDEGKGREFEYWVKKTAADSRRIIALKAQAERNESRGHLPAAASAYEEIAKLYGEHAALEDTLTYYPLVITKSKTTPEEYRPIFKKHYLDKQRHCLKQLYTWYQAIDEHLSSVIAIDAEHSAYHAHVLNRLIAIGKAIGKDEVKEISPYLRRVAHMITDHPHASVSTTPSAPEDIILHSASGSGSESDSDESASLLASPARPALTFGSVFRWLGFGTDAEAKID